jgi:hypothetical protein
VNSSVMPGNTHKSCARRYACELQPLPPSSPEPIQLFMRALESCLPPASAARFHVLCTHQDQVMELSVGTILLAGNDACKHGMVRSASPAPYLPFFSLPHSPKQLAYGGNAISLQGELFLTFNSTSLIHLKVVLFSEIFVAELSPSSFI